MQRSPGTLWSITKRYGNAKVSANAKAYGDALVSDNAQVYGDANVDTYLYGDAV